MALLSRKVAASAPIPQLETFDSGYAADMQRDRDLRRQLRDIERDLDAIRTAPRSDAASDRVAALLGDDVPETVVPATETRRKALVQEQADIRVALDVLQGRIGVSRRAATAAAWQQIGGTRRELLDGLCRALVATKTALGALVAFDDRAIAAGISTGSLPSINSEVVFGDPRDPNGSLNWLLADAVRAGLLDKSEVQNG